MIYKYLLLPQNYLAEEILLGIILIYPNLFYHVINSIKIEYLFLENHKIIYTCLLVIYKKNKLSLNYLLYTLDEINILSQIGGISKISDLMKQSQIFITSYLNINLYTEETIKLIQYNYIKRIMIQYGHNIIRLAYIPKISHHKIYNKASSYLNIAEKKIPKNYIKTFKELISEFLLTIQYKSNKYKTNLKNEKYQLIKSHFTQLDELIFGLPKGDLIVIAGRPSMGKTSLAINIAYNILINHSKIGIYIFSLEMSKYQILNKFIAIDAKIPLQRIILKNLNTIEWTTIVKTCYQLINLEIYINDNTNTSIDYIEYTSKLIKKENKTINLIIIDYLQLIQANILNKINRSQELSYITRKLKILAQYLQLPIIILSQLNRNIENRSSKQPILSDLKESGCIELSNQINIKKNINNKIYINNMIDIFSHLEYMNNINKIKQICTKLYKKRNIFLFVQYIFLCIINHKYKLLLTYNHKYIFNQSWIKHYLSFDNSFLKKYKNLYNQSIIHNYYINNIKFYFYKKSYDLNTQNYFNFVCNKIILHNSIEQDADIVMMISQAKNEQQIRHDEKILDIIIAKNRNGPTGSINLLFFPRNSIFNSVASV